MSTYKVVPFYASAAHIALATKYSTLAEAFANMGTNVVIDETGEVRMFHESQFLFVKSHYARYGTMIIPALFDGHAIVGNTFGAVECSCGREFASEPLWFDHVEGYESVDDDEGDDGYDVYDDDPDLWGKGRIEDNMAYDLSGQDDL